MKHLPTHQPNRSRFALVFLLFMSLFLGSTQGWGQSIFTNPIDGENPNDFNPYTSGQTVTSGISASGIGRGSGIGSQDRDDSYYARNFTGSSTLDANDYFEWSLTPESCNLISFTQLALEIYKNGDGPRNLVLRSSLDSYVSNIPISATNATVTSNVASVTGNEATFFLTANLSAAGFQNLNTAITFRLYGYNGEGSNNSNRRMGVNSFTFNGTVNPDLPANVGNISGSLTVCAGQTSVYSISPVSNATSYSWTVPSGWSIVSGQGTTSITATAGAAGLGNITVQASNSCGSPLNETQITIFPENASGNTGFVTSTVKTDDGIQANSGSLRGFVKFPLTAIPGGATIISSSLTLTNNNSQTGSTTQNAVKPLGNTDPATSSAATLFTAIGAQNSGTNYSQAVWAATGELSLSLNSTASADIQSRFSSPGYIAMGLARGGTFTYNFFGYSSGANAPKLIVTFTGPKSISVTVNPRPDATITVVGQTTFCQGGSVQLSVPVQENCSYLWSQSAGITNSVTVSSGGQYTCTVTNDQTGCSSTSTQTNITVNALPTAPAGTNGSRCGAGTLSISATPGAGETIDWYAAPTGGSVLTNGSGVTSYTTPSISTSTTYYAEARNTSTGCVSSTRTAVTATVNTIPSVTATANQTVCAGTSVTLSGAGASSYSWNNGITNGVAFTPVSTTTYTVTGTAANGCIATANSTVTVTPTNTAGSASSNPTLCVNTALTNITHTTTGATGISNSGASGANGLPAGVTASWASNTITISGTPTASGTFTYSIPLTGGCGTVNATGTITVNPNLPASVSIAASATTICAGTSVTFTATPTNGGTIPAYQWKVNGVNAGTNSATFTTTSLANNDEVTVVLTSNASPCLTGSPATSNTVTMTVNPTLTASVTIAASSTGICSGNSITFTATPTNGGASPAYVWTRNGVEVSGQNNATFASGSFANGDVISCVMTSNASPCLVGSPATSNAVTITVNPIVTPTFTQVAPICSGETLNALPTTSTNGIIGTWSPAMNNAATTEYTFTPDAGQCASTATMTITVTAPTTYYQDADGDGFGNPDVSMPACEEPVGYVSNSDDCNDNSPSANSNSQITSTTTITECGSYTWSANNITYNESGTYTAGTACNTQVLNLTIIEATFSRFLDSDGDGYGAGAPILLCTDNEEGYSELNTDCDDDNVNVFPEATEVCNLIDDDCDGSINEEIEGTTPYYQDADNDSFGSSIAVALCQPTVGYVLNNLDCDDTNSAINPQGEEICGNEIDEDCAAGDLVPAYYKSIQSGAWNDDATWSYSCDNSAYNNANYFPPVGYNGFVLIAEGTTVTIPNNDTIYSTGTLQINGTGTLNLTGNPALNNPSSSLNNIPLVAKLTVSVAIANNGTLNMGHQASLVQTSTTAGNTGSGLYNIQTAFTGTTNVSSGNPNGRYWYVGSPMNNTNISNTFYSALHKTRIWEYIPTNNSWGAIINGSTGAGLNSPTNMTVGIGYLYRAGSQQNVTYTGTGANLNNNITTPTSLTGVGYKFVANPYPSYVDWRAVTRTGLNVSYWIRNAANTNYESFNATSGLSNSPSGQTTRFIPPMQGFWVYAFTSAASLRIDNGDRTHSTNVLHAPLHNQVVRLNLNDGKTDDQAVVYENDNAENGIEEFDTDKFMDENYHQIYFLEGTKPLSLDGLNNATEKQKVDMGIQITGAGTYTINAVELGVEEDVVLEDKFTQTFQDLKSNATYTFTSNAGTYNNRFVLHFTLNAETESATESETVTVTETEVETEGVNVYTTTGQQVKVWVTNTADFQNATVKVYDAIGNLVERKNMTSNELLLDLDIANGIYVVEVTGAEKTFTKKVFIGK